MSTGKENFFRRHLHRSRAETPREGPVREVASSAPPSVSQTKLVTAPTSAAKSQPANSSQTKATLPDRTSQHVRPDAEVASTSADYSADPSLLWDEAYDAVKQADPEMMEKYELFLKDPKEGLEEDLTSVRGMERRKRMDRLLQRSLEKTARQDRVEGAIGEVVEIVLSIKDTIGAAVSSVPIAAAAWTPICIALSVFSKSVAEENENRSGIVEIVKKMKWYSSLSLLLLENDQKGDGRFQELVPQIADRIRDLYVHLLKYVITTVCAYNSNVIFRNFNRLFEDWKATMEGINSAEVTVITLTKQYRGEKTNTYLKLMVKSHLDQKETKVMQALYFVDVEAEMDSLQKRKDPLIRDSYDWILRTPEYERFTDWQSHQDGILWIKGDAGMGKTMLVMGIIHELRRALEEKFAQPSLAYFFCQGTNSSSNNATLVLKALIWQLLRQQRSLVKYLTEEYDVTGDQFLTSNNAFYTLSKILKAMLEDETFKTTVFIVDALDECLESQQPNWQPGLKELVHLMLETSNGKVKWLVSSRRLLRIEEIMMGNEQASADDGKSDAGPLTIDVNPDSIAKALQTYIDRKVTALKLKYEQKPRTNARPSEMKRLQKQRDLLDTVNRRILQETNGTFLWVSIVLREMNGCEPQEMLKRLESMPLDLQHLYARIVNRIEQSPHVESCKMIISMILTAYRPLHVDELVTLADLNQRNDIESYLENTGLLTVQEGIVYLLHQSTKDYLLQCKDTNICELYPGHDQIVKKSLEAMDDDLSVDMYELRDPAVSVSEIDSLDTIPLQNIRYSCANWMEHLCELTDDEKFANLCEDSNVFLKAHLLQWVEALCLMKCLSNILKSTTKLEERLKDNQILSSFRGLIHDLDRLMRFSKDGIENYPLQIYAFAQPFAPTSSATRLCSRTALPSWITASSIMPRWDDCIYSFSGNAALVDLSPCGKYLATSFRHTIRIYDLTNGSCSQTLQGTPFFVEALCYSRNGELLASATNMGLVQIWDVVAGTCLQTLTPAEVSGGESTISGIHFSPVDDRLAVAAHRITIWNARDGSLAKVIEHEVPKCICFSPDGKSVVAASQIIRVWDAETESIITTIENHANWAIFSPNGDQIASIFCPTYRQSDTLRTHAGLKLWNVRTGVHLRTLTTSVGGGIIPQQIGFSPDSLRIAAGSNDNSVKIWSLGPFEDGNPTTLHGHSSEVIRVAFSHDGRNLATASMDHCVKYWAIPTGMQADIEEIHRHKSYVRDIVLSPNKKWFISVSENTIKIWNVEGEHLATLPAIRSTAPIVISPNSRWFATSSNFHDERMDRSEDTSPIFAAGSDESSNSDQFSRSNDSFHSNRSAIPEETTHQEDVSGLEETANMGVTTGPKEPVRPSIPDDDDSDLYRLLNCFIRLRDYRTGKCQRVFTLEEYPANALAFSADAEIIAAGATSRISAWNIASEACIFSFDSRRHTNRLPMWEGGILVLGFNPTGTTLVHGPYRGDTKTSPDTVQLYNVHQNICEHTITLEKSRTNFIPTGDRAGRVFSELVVEAVFASTPPPRNISHLPAEIWQMGMYGIRISEERFGISEDMDWITRDGSRILWLPPIYRPSSFAVAGSTVILGCASGYVLCLKGLDDFTISVPKE